MNLLSARHLTKKYDHRTVLTDVSLNLVPGEILAIIGRSGSGKSTLIRILAGLLEADQGDVLFNGTPLEGPDKRLVPGYEEIRLVHQDFQLKHKMTVRENIRYELLAYEKAYQEERIQGLLQLCGIGHLEHNDIALVSGGEKQRVAIARAMATEPDILLMDEPFSNLDLNTKYTLLDELKHIASSTDTAIILITHDARDAMEIADRLIVLDEGKVIREGTPEALYHHPRFARVAELIGFYNTISPSALQQLSPDFHLDGQDHQLGIWAEDVVPAKKGIEGEIQKVVFGGPHNKILLRTKGITLWAYDFTKRLIPGQSITFTIRQDRIFSIE